MLHLADYACQELLVSFAVSNMDSVSNFSIPTRITVHGGRQYVVDKHTTSAQLFLLECRVPETPLLSNGSTNHVNLTEEEMNHLLAEGSCFLACLSSDNINIDEV